MIVRIKFMWFFLGLSVLSAALSGAVAPTRSPSRSIDAWGEEVEGLGFFARSIAFGLIGLCVMATCCSFAACLVWLCCRGRRRPPDEDAANFTEIEDDAVPPTLPLDAAPRQTWQARHDAAPYPPAA